MYTNKTRLTGLSGLDTDTLVKQLMKAESVKYDRLKKNNVLLTWKQEAYRDVQASLKTFQNTFFSFTNQATNLRSSNTFGGFTSSAKIAGADTKNATVTATGTAKEGSYKLEVLELAQKHAFESSTTIGGSVSSDFDITTANLANIKAGDTIKVALDGTVKEIKLAGGYADINALKDDIAGKIDAAYGAGKVTVGLDGNKLKFSPIVGHELKFYEGTINNTADANYKLSGDLTADTLKTAITAGTEYSFNVSVAGGAAKTIKISLNQDELTDKSNDTIISTIASKINTALSSEGIKDSISASVEGGKLRLSAGRQNDVTITAGGPEDLLTKIQFPSGTNLEPTSVLAQIGMKAGTANALDTSKLLKDIPEFASIGASNGTFSINGVEISYSKDSSLQKLINDINSSAAGVTMSYDNISRKFSLTSKEAGSANAITIADTDGLLASFNLSEKTPAQDARFILNDVETTRSSNNFEINGLKIQLNEKTAANSPITIDVVKDTTKPMETIKKFVEEYNKLIDKLNTLTNTNVAKNGKYGRYEPLTDEERQAMSDKEADLWDDKAKQGLLYRDSILNGITSSMRTYLYQSVEVSDGLRLSLHDIGIDTSANWREAGKLVIDEDKLKTALEERGSDVGALFTKSFESGLKGNDKLVSGGLAERMNDILESAAGSYGSIAKQAGIKGETTATNNVLYKQMEQQTDKMADMLRVLREKETYYYGMFAKMEAAMNQSNTQMSYLQTQLGM